MKAVGAIEKISPRLKETGLETNHAISFLNRCKTSKDPAVGRILGAVCWGNGAAGPFLRDATQNIKFSDSVWSGWQTTFRWAGLTGQQDQGTAHSKKMFWDRNTAACPGSRQLEQKGSGRSQDCRAALPGHPGDRARWRAPKHRANQAATEMCTPQGWVPMARHDLQ